MPGASEGGHADFAARTPRELEMVRELTRIFGRVGDEHVISGPGLVNIYQFTHQSFGTGPTLTSEQHRTRAALRGVGGVTDFAELPARISRAAMERRCDALRRGDGHLRLGVRRRGGQRRAAHGRDRRRVCRRRHRAEDPAGARTGLFLEAFRAKEPMADFVATIPVAVILNPDAGLLGAAVHAQQVTLGVA